MRIHYLMVLIAPLFLGFESSATEAATNSPDFMPGGGGHSYVQVVWHAYMQAWQPASSHTKSGGITRASVVIAKNGKVVSAKIIKPSGDELADKSVQKVLDKIGSVQPFESGAKDEQRVFIISFDLRVKK